MCQSLEKFFRQKLAAMPPEVSFFDICSGPIMIICLCLVKKVYRKLEHFCYYQPAFYSK